MKEDFKKLDQFKEFYLKEKPEVEAYSFRGKDFQWGFTIVFTAGRILLGGDAGDNVFTVGGTNHKLKEWLIDVDMEYALSKSHQGKEYFDKDFAEKYLRKELKEDGVEPSEINKIIESLDFSCHELLLNSMSDHRDNFPEISEYRLLGWSPMQKMQYKQLLFAGNWLKNLKICEWNKKECYGEKCAWYGKTNPQLGKVCPLIEKEIKKDAQNHPTPV